MMRGVVRALIALWALVLAALVGPAAVAQPTQGSSPEIRLLNAGRGPREQLRLAPTVGASEHAVMTLRMRFEQSGISQASISLPIRATVVETLQVSTPTGDLHTTYSYPSFEVLEGKDLTDAQREAVQQALTGFNGLSGELTVTTRNEYVDGSLDLPPDLDPRISQFLGQLRDQARELTVPLPAEAVGQGARWRATTQLTLNGIQVRDVFEYQLKRRAGTTLDLDVRGRETASRQTVDTPQGATLRVKDFKTTFRGTTTLDLTRLAPIRAGGRGRGSQTFEVRVGGESGELRQTLAADVSVTRA
jgi:hypothetical protein